MNNVLLGGDGWVYYETIGGGQGGRPWADGHERRAHRDDEHARHAGRGARARAAAAGAPLRTAPGERWRRRAPGWRRHRRELEVLEPIDGVARHRAPASARRGASPAARPARWARTGCCPAATSRARRRLPDKCTVHARAGRRAAHPHAGRRWLGTALLDRRRRTAGAASRDRGLRTRRATSRDRVDLLDARSSMRRRPVGHALEALGHEPRVGVARGVERRTDHAAAASTHIVARLGRRERARARRRRCRRHRA